MDKTFQEKVTEAKSEIMAISPQKAYEQKNRYPETLFIDPRNMADIKKTTGIIPGAINLLLNLLDTPDYILPDIFSDNTRPIIASCQAGPMAALAAYALKKRGYKNVQFIDGGTQGWLDAGFETIQ